MNKRVLYLHPHFTLPGGAGRHALETGRVLASRGWDIHIASIKHHNDLVSDYKNLISFHALGGPLSSSLWYWPHLPLLLRKVLHCIDTVNPDILFTQVFPANWWGFIAKVLRGRAIHHVWMCQEPSAFIHSRRWLNSLPYNTTGILARVGNPILKKIDVYLARNVDYVFANSSFSTQLASSAYCYPSEKIGICYPGVDLSRFTPSSTNQRIRYKFLTCARLTKFKNIHLIIKALARITDTQITLTVIGKGEEYRALRNLTTSLQLDSRVSFLQSISDEAMIEELRSSFCLIHAAEEEPFGLTPVEAMACGTPVIAMRNGGPAETVVHEKTGYLCPYANEETIVEAVKWIIAQETRANEMFSACVERAREFTWESAATSLEAVFRRAKNVSQVTTGDQRPSNTLLSNLL